MNTPTASGDLKSGMPVAEIITHIDNIRRRPALRDRLVGMLAEHAPIYGGRGVTEAELLRSYVMSSFKDTGLPEAARPFIHEELESGRHPNTVAAAAMALQGDPLRGKADMSDRTVVLLFAAIDRMMPADDVVDFESSLGRPDDNAPATVVIALIRAVALRLRSPLAHTALVTLLADHAADLSPQVRAETGVLLRSLSGATQETTALETASCCCGPSPTMGATPREQAAVTPDRITNPLGTDLADIELEDQEGARTTFGTFFAGRLSVLTFFYTRCTNPEKCSLTISKLGRLQQRFRTLGWSESVNVAAITYDPAFDLPPRLKGYGSDRGMTFDGRNRLLRTRGAFDPLQRHFELGVGFGPVTVNRHSLDLLILDAAGNATEHFSRELWSEDDVVAALESRMNPVKTPHPASQPETPWRPARETAS